MGKDSLPDTYKHPEDPNTERLYQDGDTWFRDMRAPGFNGGLVNNADNSLPWLGQRMANDPRFATAAVKFWWPAVMGADAALAPEEVSDSDYSERLALFEEQNGFIEALGQQFSQGINGGKPFNGKDLLTETHLLAKGDVEVPPELLPRFGQKGAPTIQQLTREQLMEIINWVKINS